MRSPDATKAAPAIAGNGPQMLDLLGGSRLADIPSPRRNQSLFGSPPEPRLLRPYQARQIELVESAFAEGKRRVILQSPTGSGKTRVAVELILKALDRGERCAFVVPYLTLIKQSLDAFTSAGVPLGAIGIVQGDHPLSWRGKAVKICSVQTLSARYYRPQVDLVILDEAQRTFKFTQRWLGDTSLATRFLGLSATPWCAILTNS
jgi:DNA repair protein RadD